MKPPKLTVTERFASPAPPSREAIQAAVALWLTGAIQSQRPSGEV